MLEPLKSLPPEDAPLSEWLRPLSEWLRPLSATVVNKRALPMCSTAGLSKTDNSKWIAMIRRMNQKWKQRVSD